MKEQTTKVAAKRFFEDAWHPHPDHVAVEEPLEIVVTFGPEGQRKTQSLSVTMRTPGADADLVAGFLLTEGIVRQPGDILSLAHRDFRKNTMLAELSPILTFDMKQLERHFYTSSSCGVCGKTSIEALVTTKGIETIAGEERPRPSPFVLTRLPQLLREAQHGFELSGGLHAAAIFDDSGQLCGLREDVGRHNALDKLVGYSFQNGKLPLESSILLLSGRISFELVQKSAMAGIGTVCAIGAPSNLAIETAQRFGIRLFGFLRMDRFNQYC
jgi:FdhD protein